MLILLPLEMTTGWFFSAEYRTEIFSPGYLEKSSGVIVNSMHLNGSSAEKIEFLDVITKPLIKLIVQVRVFGRFFTTIALYTGRQGSH